MRTLAILGLLTLVSISTALAAKTVTVAELEQTLAVAHGKPDVKLAEQLSYMELGERVSSATLAQLTAALPGPQSRQALMVLADATVFLNLPEAEIPETPAPDVTEQRRILSLVADYAIRMVRKLPNLSATRNTTRFEDPPEERIGGGGQFRFQPFRALGTSTVTVLFRDGIEQARTEKDKRAKTAEQDLSSRGEFGPIIFTVLKDVAKGEMAWSHWEQGTTGGEAVFRYRVPEKASHYRVEAPTGGDDAHESPAYHGEMAVNPTDGSVMRLTMQADLKDDDLVTRADLEVEYGSVEIGSKFYICPIKSVAISRVAVMMFAGRVVRKGSTQTRVNDVQFGKYHLFRAESRLLVGDGSEGESKTP